jgi:RimJ/RimL family protein N-acetyltransferase
MSEVRLVPFAADHAEAVAALLDDPEILRFTRIPEPAPEGFAEQWVERYERGRREGRQMGFAALDAGGGFVGLALAPVIDAAGGEVELGYLVAPAARGRGVATAMLRQLTEWAFGELGAQRAYLIISVDNVASERVAARSGYTREGVMRSVHLKQGRRGDAALWSRLPTDRPPS